MESVPIDPASDEHVLGGKLLKSQHAGVGRLPTLCPDHKAFDKGKGGRKGPEIGELDGRERRMKWVGMTERKWGSGHYLQYELQIVCRQRKKLPPDV